MFVVITFYGERDCNDSIGYIMILLLSPKSHLDSSPAELTGETPAVFAKEYGVDFMIPV